MQPGDMPRDVMWLRLEKSEWNVTPTCAQRPKLNISKDEKKAKRGIMSSGAAGNSGGPEIDIKVARTGTRVRAHTRTHISSLSCLSPATSCTRDEEHLLGWRSGMESSAEGGSSWRGCKCTSDRRQR